MLGVLALFALSFWRGSWKVLTTILAAAAGYWAWFLLNDFEGLEFLAVLTLIAVGAASTGTVLGRSRP